MHPELFTLPILGITIKTYGFFLMVGFLTAVWLAMRAAQRVKANPDLVLDVSFLALVFGVGGSRLFYVVHYWKSQFAFSPNKFLAVIDIRQGGLEFLGGLLGAMTAILLYLWWKRESIRLYLDVLAPGAMWGLAFGRLGCFFNGCCFGGLCTVPGTTEALRPWAVRFPYGSPVYVQEWEDRLVTVPAELVISHGLEAPYLLPPTALALSVEKREGPQREVDRLERELQQAQSDAAAGERTAQLSKELARRKDALQRFKRDNFLTDLERAQALPSRRNPERKTSVSELQELAAASRSLPVHPTQLYSSIHALVLAGLLTTIFYRRRRHGLVIGLLFVFYPIGRVLLETIRVDNPHDAGGLTASQLVGVAMFTLGVAYLVVLYTTLPERSPVLDRKG